MSEALDRFAAAALAPSTPLAGRAAVFKISPCLAAVDFFDAVTMR